LEFLASFAAFCSERPKNNPELQTQRLHRIKKQKKSQKSLFPPVIPSGLSAEASAKAEAKNLSPSRASPSFRAQRSGVEESLLFQGKKIPKNFKIFLAKSVITLVE
jgi:hypothetical protein